MVYRDIYIHLVDKWRKKRTTDFVWSNHMCRLDQLIRSTINLEKSGNYVLHYLQGGPVKAFVCEELMHIPQDSKYLLSGLVTGNKGQYFQR